MGISTARQAAALVESRSLREAPTLPTTPRELMAAIRRCLITAADERVLKTAPYRIFQLLKHREQEIPSVGRVFFVLGGASMDKGQETDEFFHRSDGARISFGVTVIFGPDGLPKLQSYRFHLRFSGQVTPVYVRFDLNQTTGDPLFEPRCHVHTGAEPLRVAAPLMGPVEVLQKLLYGMPAP